MTTTRSTGGCWWLGEKPNRGSVGSVGLEPRPGRGRAPAGRWDRGSTRSRRCSAPKGGWGGALRTTVAPLGGPVGARVRTAAVHDSGRLRRFPRRPRKRLARYAARGDRDRGGAADRARGDRGGLPPPARRPTLRPRHVRGAAGRGARRPVPERARGPGPPLAHPRRGGGRGGGGGRLPEDTVRAGDADSAVAGAAGVACVVSGVLASGAARLGRRERGRSRRARRGRCRS